jgi:protocatechuate 3,4-dioxygenase beta subunit
MENDDRPIGRILDRREMLALLGTMGAATLLGACVQPGAGAPGNAASTGASAAAVATTNATLAPGCVVRPELTEGPVFVEEELNRSDIRLDPSNGVISAGVQFDLTFRVTQVGKNACTPLSGVKIDVWHCDGAGIYSDTTQLGMHTVGQKFLRGYQHTDANGIAKFTTIYPGWYEGRTVHIHFKMRNEQGYEFTSQLFFDDTLTDEVFKADPYASKGERKLRNADDSIYQQSGGQMILEVETVPTGYAATFDVGLQIA